MPVLDRQFSGARLRAAREAAGMSCEELAAEIGRDANTIRRYELGRYRIPLLVARVCAMVLEIDLDDLAVSRKRARR